MAFDEWYIADVPKLTCTCLLDSPLCLLKYALVRSHDVDWKYRGKKKGSPEIDCRCPRAFGKTPAQKGREQDLSNAAGP